MRKLFTLLLFAPGFIATAQPLVLDPGFGNNGVAVCQDSGRANAAYDLVQQPDGKILAAGMTYADDGQLYYESLISRFLSDGSLDNSFGTEGSVRLVTGNKNAAYALRVQPDGKIVIVGNETIMIEDGGPPPSVQILSRPFIARLKATGALDSSFGDNGIHHLDILNAYTDKELGALVLLPDGKLRAGGNIRIGETSKFLAISLNADGTYDNSFGTSGMATYTPENGKDATLFDMTLQSDGKIILAGSSGTLSLIMPPDSKFALARINMDGTPDAGFGTQGFVVTQVSSGAPYPSDIIGKIRLQADGKIYVAGQSGIHLALGRYNDDGTPDLSFGQNGFIVHEGYVVPTGFTLRDGKLYTCGSLPGADYSLSVKVAGFHANGTIDTTVSPDTVYTGDIYHRNYAHAMITQADGKLLVAGSFKGQNDEQGTLLIRLSINTPTDIPSVKGRGTTIQLYPNPVGDILTLVNNAATGSSKEVITIFNTLGQAVYTGICKEQKNPIPVGHLAAGNYLVRLSGKNSYQVLKFVKQ